MFIDSLRQDLRIGLRVLIKEKGFCALAVTVLALGICAVTTQFSVVNGVMLRGFSFPHAERLASVQFIEPNPPQGNLFGNNSQIFALDYLEIAAAQKSFEHVAAYINGSTVNVTHQGNPRRYTGAYVTENFLKILGVSPARGRDFTAADNSPGAEKTALISHDLWQRDFGGSLDILGTTVRLNGRSATIIGVMPAGFAFPVNEQIWIPLFTEFPAKDRNNLNAQGNTPNVIGLLRPDVSVEQANSEIATIASRLAQQFPESNKQFSTGLVEPLIKAFTPRQLAGLLLSMLAICVLVLLLACSNVMNMQFARATLRAKELAIRSSLGASRGEIVRQFLTESLLFTLVSSALGVLLAWWSLQGIQTLAGQQLPRVDEITLDATVLGFALAVALAAGLVIGLYPALQASRTDVNSVLKDNTRGAGGGTAAKSFRHLLVVTQVALSLCLLICAGLLVLSFHRLQNTQPGFSTAGRAFGGINLPAAKYGSPELIREFYASAQERLRDVPGLAHAGLTANLPLNGGGFLSPYLVQGRPVVPFSERPLATISNVSADYFTTVGITLKSGRFFADTDRATSTQVAIINETLAKKLFPDTDPLNHAFVIGPNSDIITRIVGVVRDVKTVGLNVPPPDEIYYPLTQRGPSFCTIVGHAQPGLAAAAVIPLLRRALADLDPALALANAQTMDALLLQSVGVQRLTLALLLAFAAIAALLAVVGVYSVMAYAVTQRTGEIGVRMALGATPAHILRLVLRAGTAQIALGLTLGLVGALAASRLLEQALFEVKPFDPLVFALVALVFAVVALLACLVPARRATRLDPMLALRTE